MPISSTAIARLRLVVAVVAGFIGSTVAMDLLHWSLQGQGVSRFTSLIGLGVVILCGLAAYGGVRYGPSAGPMTAGAFAILGAAAVLLRAAPFGPPLCGFAAVGLASVLLLSKKRRRELAALFAAVLVAVLWFGLATYVSGMFIRCDAHHRWVCALEGTVLFAGFTVAQVMSWTVIRQAFVGSDVTRDF